MAKNKMNPVITAMAMAYVTTRQGIRHGVELMKSSEKYSNDEIILLCEYVYKLSILERSVALCAEQLLLTNDVRFPTRQIKTLINDCADIEEELAACNLPVSLH